MFQESFFMPWPMWIFQFLLNVFLGAFVIFVLIATMKQRGKRALLLLPLALYLFLWNSWTLPRTELMWSYLGGWAYGWMDLYWGLHDFLLFFLFALALVPLLLKYIPPVQETEPEEPPKPV